ncbi:MAG: hypothetical protein D6755_12160 [Anaerolineae bacterium]|nr:MAG: hypothetical protein D6755_12160 [Anaerolineae bacterium]
MHTYFPIFSTLVTFAFAAAVLRRYYFRRGSHLLLWGLGLVMYGLGTLTEVWLSFGFNAFALKIWYLMGAMLTAAWLGQGSIHLLVRKRNVAPTLTGVLAVLSVLAAVLVFSAPITAAAAGYVPSQPVSMQYKEILTRSGLSIALTIILNIYGTLGLVGGALYSAYLFWRKQVLFDRMIGNVLIAAGALMPAMAGSFIKAGLGDWLYLSELLGAVLMYIGFLRATAGKKVGVQQPAAAD